MSKRFIILFEQKEGSTPMIRLLDNFDAIDIVHQVSNTGWEPFDRHTAGPMPFGSYLRCLELIFGPDEPYMDELNSIYSSTSSRPLEAFDKKKNVGFKMRLRPQHDNRFVRWIRSPKFKRETFNILLKHGVVVFVTVRQDVFRWALSMYHGNGTGQPGHLQFKLAKGLIKRSDIPPINVDLADFRPILKKFENQIEQKRQLIERLNGMGIPAFPLLYEEFCGNQVAFFQNFVERLELPLSADDVRAALDQGTDLKKVHSDDISEFVINADEVLAEFGDRYIPW
jgi:hypothetical protein